MKLERPILMSAPMVRAILAGTKTQTRRVVKLPGYVVESCGQDGMWPIHEENGAVARCPYGLPGDRLWVRETHAFSVVDPDGLDWRDDPENWDVFYRADTVQPAGGWRDAEGKVIPPPWRPSIHMPRWASRITLEITGVRVERLQGISEADVMAEGITEFIGGWWSKDAAEDSAIQAGATPQEGYRHLWEQINGSGSWDANPWVWVIQFQQLVNR